MSFESWYDWHLLKREEQVGKQIVALDTKRVKSKKGSLIHVKWLLQNLTGYNSFTL